MKELAVFLIIFLSHMKAGAFEWRENQNGPEYSPEKLEVVRGRVRVVAFDEIKNRVLVRIERVSEEVGAPEKYELCFSHRGDAQKDLVNAKVEALTKAIGDGQLVQMYVSHRTFKNCLFDFEWQELARRPEKSPDLLVERETKDF